MNRPCAYGAIGLLLVVWLSGLPLVGVGPVVPAGSFEATGDPARLLVAADRSTAGTLGTGGIGSPLVVFRPEGLVELVPVLASAVQQGLDPVTGTEPASVLLVVNGHRVNDEPDFENDRRETIYDAISETPGRYIAGLVSSTGIPASTVRYHLRVLEAGGLIQSTMIRGKRRFHLPHLDTEAVTIMAACADESTAPILDAVSRLEPVNVSEVAEELGIARSTVSYHLKRLAADDLVTRERRGQTVLTWLVPAVRSRIQAATGAEGVSGDASAE